MQIPNHCEVLIIGGGPAGSYAACVLAREGFDTVLLERDIFPRYHVGESMIPSLRHFLRFIDLDDKFDSYGFQVKKSAAFKLNETRKVGFTDFIAAGGKNGYAWNVSRGDADNLIFQHAKKSGAKAFDGVKVKSISFQPLTSPKVPVEMAHQNLGQAVSAEWVSKDGASGKISFEYVIDATGRNGLMSTQYLKNRQFNEGLKHIAYWGYWIGAATYGIGTRQEGCPYFEHLRDGSGWVWFIPLHNNTTSVGVVRRQDVAMEKKKAKVSTTLESYLWTIRNEVPDIDGLLSGALMTSDQKIHTASDWSYSASTYAGPNYRIVGDAGCFVDPLFSSGVHIAFTSGLSAAITIAASKKGDCTEEEAGNWHTAKVQRTYSRFLIVVLAGMKQIHMGATNVLAYFDEPGFETAFSYFRPIMQGTADVSSELTKEEVSKTLDFCISILVPTDSDEAQAKLRKEKEDSNFSDKLNSQEAIERKDNVAELDSLSSDVINGMKPKLSKGSIGLALVTQTEERTRTGLISTLKKDRGLIEKYTKT